MCTTDLPKDFTDRMKDQLGGEYEAFIGSYESPAIKALRINRRRVQAPDYARMCSIATGMQNLESVDIWPGAYYYDSDMPGKNPLHEAGAYYIQEASAMYPVTLLDVDDSKMKVLDLCAAPGGKTTQIADLMNGEGLLVANEVIRSRASILSENVERMGVTNCLLTSEDPTVLADRFPAFFDRILVDAPCSGEGMFRKNPEAASEWSLENVKMCAARQDMILDCAANMLAPGGRIVYSTCTFSPEEDEGAACRFIKRHPEFVICDGPHRLYPHTFRGEGHFAVALSRADKVKINASNDVVEGRGSCQPAHQNTYNGFEDTLGKFFDNKDRLISFGDSLYFAPENMPDISGLKVLRAGLKLGTFRKNRFEPDHALSHALGPNDVSLYVDLDPGSKAVRDYIAGMTIPCDQDAKGWCLVCTGGISLGWGKASGGVIKNHYPKGLRK